MENSENSGSPENAPNSDTLKRIVVQMDKGQLDDALNNLRAVLHDQPDNGMALFLTGVCHRRQGTLEEAMRIQKALIARNVELAGAWQEMGLNFLQMDRVNDAIDAFRRATTQNPDLPISWRMLGDLYIRQNDQAGAVSAYEHVGYENQKHPFINRALELMKEDKPGQADRLLRRCIALHPDDSEPRYLMSRIAIRVGAISDAILILGECLARDPGHLRARFDYVDFLAKRQRYGEALVEIEPLLQAQPDNPSYQLLHASILEHTGCYQQALHILQRLNEASPGQAEILNGMGYIQRTLGEADEANASFFSAIQADPLQAESWFALANMKNYRFSENQVSAMQASLNRQGTSTEDLTYLRFALGKAADQEAQRSTAFEHYQKGNELKATQVTFNGNAHDTLTRGLITSCEKLKFDDRHIAALQDSSPVFIVGLPRSGTTLVEQILAAHSQVDGLKELANLPTLVLELNYERRKRKLTPYPAALTDLKPKQLEELGRKYLAGVDIHRANAPYFTDKMPNNFEHIGLIARILPQAKIVHVRRHPMATGFSVFRQLFNSGQEWSYRFEDIAHYTRNYLELMDQWDKLLPGKIHPVPYENLVNDTEGEVNALLNYLGLDFEAQCLEFYRQDRPVRSASSEQVREPIHQQALDEWRQYADQLEPLKRAYESFGVSIDG